MAGFAAVSSSARAPGRVILLEPGCFADEWENKPRDAVAVGIRVMSELDKSKARSQAQTLADELHADQSTQDKYENWVDAYNDCLMRQVAALGICDPNDVNKGTDILPYAEMQVRTALSSRGTAFIFGEINRYEIEACPVGEPASDADLDELSYLLEDAKDALNVPQRKLLMHVLEQLRNPT